MLHIRLLCAVKTLLNYLLNDYYDDCRAKWMLSTSAAIVFVYYRNHYQQRASPTSVTVPSLVRGTRRLRLLDIWRELWARATMPVLCELYALCLRKRRHLFIFVIT